MRIKVHAKAGAKEEKVVPPEPQLMPDDLPVYKVHVKEPAEEGRANAGITRALAKHFGVLESEVRLLAGSASRHKIFKIGTYTLISIDISKLNCIL